MAFFSKAFFSERLKYLHHHASKPTGSFFNVLEVKRRLQFGMGLVLEVVHKCGILESQRH